jgi:tetratricopeptide (TPR) repeat protein
VRLADEALAIARRCGDGATLAHVLLQRFFTISYPDNLEERLANTEELVALAENLGDPVISARALLLRYRALVEAGDIVEADRRLETAEQLTQELGQPTLQWLVGLNRTARTIMTGDLEVGERQALGGFELWNASGQADAATWLAAHLFIIRFVQDRLGEIEERLEERVAALPGLYLFRAYLALLLCELDRPEDATEHYELLAAQDFSGLPQDSTWMLAAPHCAAVCAHLGDQTRAPALFDLLVPYASQVIFTAAGSLGAMARYVAVLAATFGDFDEAEAHFAVAAATDQRISAPICLARTRLEWARMLLNRRGPGDTERARQLLGDALTTARELGSSNVEPRAVRLLT